MSKKRVNINKMTLEELKAFLEEKQKAELAAEARKKAKVEWLGRKDEFVTEMVAKAQELQDALISFKNLAFNGCLEIFDENYVKIQGAKPEYRPACFQLHSSDNKFMIEFDASPKYSLNDTALAAIAKLQEFIGRKFKGSKDEGILLKMLQTALSKNQRGEYSPAIVSKLIKLKDEISDPDFIDAVTQLQESQTVSGKASYVRFYRKVEKSEHGDHGQYVAIPLQFSAL